MKTALTYRNSRDIAYDHVKENDEQEAESSTFASGGLSVHFGERERSAAVDDGVKVGDAIQDGNGIAESCDQTQRYLGEDSLGQIDFWVGKLYY